MISETACDKCIDRWQPYGVFSVAACPDHQAFTQRDRPMDPKRATAFLAVLVLVLALLSWLPRGTPPPQSAAARDFDYLVANGVPRKVARAAVMR
jgi:hypothetical protein